MGIDDLHAELIGAREELHLWKWQYFRFRNWWPILENFILRSTIIAESCDDPRLNLLKLGASNSRLLTIWKLIEQLGDEVVALRTLSRIRKLIWRWRQWRFKDFEMNLNLGRDILKPREWSLKCNWPKEGEWVEFCFFNGMNFRSFFNANYRNNTTFSIRSWTSRE